MSLSDRFAQWTAEVERLRDETREAMAFRDEVIEEAVAEYGTAAKAAAALGITSAHVTAARHRIWLRSATDEDRAERASGKGSVQRARAANREQIPRV